MLAKKPQAGISKMTIEFKGSHYPKETIPVKPYIAIQTICPLSSVDATGM